MAKTKRAYMVQVFRGHARHVKDRIVDATSKAEAILMVRVELGIGPESMPGRLPTYQFYADRI